MGLQLISDKEGGISYKEFMLQAEMAAKQYTRGEISFVNEFANVIKH